MRSPARRSATIRKAADADVVEVRAGDKVLGAVPRIESETGDTMSGAFANHPAFTDFVAAFRDLARAAQFGDAEARARVSADLEAQGVQVWHTAHDMRIDQPHSLTIVDGRARFRANDAFLMMRTGGLG